MARIETRTSTGAYILKTESENPELVYRFGCPLCPFYKQYCEGLVNLPQGLSTAKLNIKMINNKEDAERLAQSAPC